MGGQGSGGCVCGGSSRKSYLGGGKRKLDKRSTNKAIGKEVPITTLRKKRFESDDVELSAKAREIQKKQFKKQDNANFTKDAKKIKKASKRITTSNNRTKSLRKGK